MPGPDDAVFGYDDSQLAEQAQFLLDFREDVLRQGRQGSNESSIVDRSALVDHDLAVSPVPRDPPGQRNAEEILADESGRTGEDPGRGMPGFVEKIRLDDDDGADLARLGAPPRAQFGEIQRPPTNLHQSSSPSATRESSSSISLTTDSRTARESRL